MRVGSDRTHQACAEEAGFLWYSIFECANYDLSESQQLAFEQISREFSSKLWKQRKIYCSDILGPAINVFDWIPTVAYNGKIVPASHTGRAPPLTEVICNLINNDNPSCPQA